VTLGFGEIVYILLVNLDRPVNITNGSQGVLGINPPKVGSFTVGAGDVGLGPLILTPTMQFYLLVSLYALVVLFCCLRLPSSRVGRAWRAMRESEAAATACGISIVRAKLSAFVFGAGVSGGAGVFAAAWYGSVFPDSFLFSESIRILSMVVLGGMGTVWGPMAGAAALVILPEVLREFEQYRLLVFGLVLVLMMRFRPQGLLAGAANRPSRPSLRERMMTWRNER
jgi:branched-chain amino acid transport system permease protein